MLNLFDVFQLCIEDVAHMALVSKCEIFHIY